MNGDGAVFTIGDLARRTGLPVKTIRYYADIGVVPPTARSSGGYRLYDAAAVARLDLVRTLRELDVDLASIRRVLDRELDLAELAAVHADALDAQIRILRTQRAVLRTVADRGTELEELSLMHRLARLSAAERQRIIDDYWASAFDGLDIDPVFAERMRCVRVELPDDPSPEQVDAWVELAELVADPGHRARVRQMAQAHHDARAAGEGMAPPDADASAFAALVAERAGAALDAGIDPASAQGRAIADELAAEAGITGDDPLDRREALADRIAMGTDARVERFWHLLAIVNGWPAPEGAGGRTPAVPTMEWFIAALRASARG
ncbi:MerR family transcriptional regulator [Allonocardiopsis opalescens]|uniref:MerR family transcriptional regulator n=1 Tax=Allonocardiopsis opalescens TaxID=1144618 RepID=UPI000D04CD92|nr:MerR family transcriptional regulator [Allonocardiopsis opalescens]